MSEGLHILPLGILLQTLHQNNTKVLKNITFVIFWWLAPGKSKNFFFASNVKNQSRKIL